MQNPVPITQCGRPGCIAFYTSDDCHFCDAVMELLRVVISNKGFSKNVLHEVNKSSPEGYLLFDHNRGVPAIRVCDKTITGIPDPDVVNMALDSISCKDCFEDVT
ncbi:MAG: hypothetical protein ACTSU3_06090 [Candidatus Thorarchaeota archaeon]